MYSVLSSASRLLSPPGRLALDLAVAGVPPERFFAAWTEAESAAGFPLDLHDLARLPESLRRRIEAEGERLT